MVRMRVFWPVTLAAALLVGLLAYGVFSKGGDTTLDEAVAKGERPTAPVASLPALGADGNLSLADYKGKVVVLNVWASWCDPCREEMPLLQATHESVAVLQIWPPPQSVVDRHIPETHPPLTHR